MENNIFKKFIDRVKSGKKKGVGATEQYLSLQEYQNGDDSQHVPSNTNMTYDMEFQDLSTIYNA